MTPFLSHGKTLALAAAAGFALAPAALAQTATSDQAVRDQTVHSDAQSRHMAPHDTFYTMEYVSARTDKGVDGFPPGTEVRLVSVNREARTLTVTDGHANIELPPDKLTNDMDIGAMVRAKDAANQESIARYQQTEMAAFQKYQQEVAEYTAKDLEKRQQAIRQADEQRQEQAATSHTSAETSAVSTGTGSNNGYYNQGGNGYGSPYGYLVDLGSTNTVIQNGNTAQPNTTGSNGKGGLSSSQGAAQSGNSRTGGSTSGTSSSTSGNSTGGSTGGKAGGKP